MKSRGYDCVLSFIHAKPKSTYSGGSSDLIGGFADFSSAAASASLPTSTGKRALAFLPSAAFCKPCNHCDLTYITLSRGQLLPRPMGMENSETGTPFQSTRPLHQTPVPPSPSATCLAVSRRPQLLPRLPSRHQLSSLT